MVGETISPPAHKKDNKQIVNNVRLKSTVFNLEITLPLAFDAHLSLDLPGLVRARNLTEIRMKVFCVI